MGLLLALFLLVLLLIAGATYEARAARGDAQRYPPPGRLIDVGGYRLHLNCTGRGAPVVVLDSGLGDSSLVWVRVQEPLARRARVCSYDRAGIAWSDPGPPPRSDQKSVEELYTLLHNAGEPPPYILVGHSSGVNRVRLFAHTYPEAVAGLVLVEPPLLAEASPVFVAALTALRRLIGALARVGGVRLLGKLGWMGLLFGGSDPPPELAQRAGFLYNPQSMRASVEETQALPETIRAVTLAATPQAWDARPVVIIAAYRGAAPRPDLAASLDRLARLSTRGRVVFVQGSHFVLFEHPERIVQAIQTILQAAP